MLHKAKQHERLVVYSMGKQFVVTAIADRADEANSYMANHKDEAVIACIGPLIIIANTYSGERKES